MVEVEVNRHSVGLVSSVENRIQCSKHVSHKIQLNTRFPYGIPYFFYIFDHLKIIIFFADRKIGITPKLTENLEPNTLNSIPDAPVHVCILIVKVRRCRTHITWVTWVTFGYYWVSFYDIRIKLFPFSFVLKTTIAEE